MLDFIYENTGLDLDLDSLVFNAKQLTYDLEIVAIDIVEELHVRLVEF
jgi:hypothetical protein